MAATELYSTYLLNDPSIKGYYRFSSNVNDSSSNGKNLTVVGSANYTTGVFGNAYTQNNSFSNYLARASDNMGIDGGAITLGCWFKDINTPGTSSSYAGIIDQKSITSWTQYGIGLVKDSGNNFIYFSRGRVGVAASNIQANWSSYVSTSVFKFYVLTYDGTTLRAYVDSELVGSISTSGNGSSVSGNTNHFRIGASEGWDGASYISNGIVDDAFIFSRALTPAEIRYLYSGVYPSGVFFHNFL